MTQLVIDDLNAKIAHQKKIVAKGKALSSLLGKKEFKELISEGYLKEEAVRLVHLMGTSAVSLHPGIQIDIHAVGSLHAYLCMIEKNAVEADLLIEDFELELEEVRKEEDE
jgi:uncharacterized protein YbcI